MTFNLTSIILSAILIANLVFAVVVVFIERRRPLDAVAWLLLFATLPVLGFVLYMFFGQKLLKQKRIRLKKADDQRLAALIEGQHQELSALQGQGTDERLGQYLGLVHMNLTAAGAPITMDNEVIIFPHGTAKFPRLLEDIAKAQRFIHMEYFIFRPDSLGQQVIAALAAKARIGVEVRLICDDWGCKLTPNSLFRPLEEAGGKVFRFLPVTLAWSFNANYRNHRKIAVIDGQIGYIGGMNVGEEYLGRRASLPNWRDTHLRIVGQAVAHLEIRFLKDYIYVSGEEMELGDRYLPPVLPQEGSTAAQIVSSGPDSAEQHVKQGYLKIITLARESLFIQTPYLVPDESILEALKVAAFSGVDVRVMIPGVSDGRLVQKVTLAYAGELLQAGVRVYQYDGFLHSKAVLADDRILSIGTANMDIRSFALNFEVNAFLYDEGKAREYRALFMDDLKRCRELTLEQYRQRTLWARVTESIARLFAPLL